MTVLAGDASKAMGCLQMRFRPLGKCTPSLQTRSEGMGRWLGWLKIARVALKEFERDEPVLSSSAAKLVTQAARRSTCDPL